MKVTKRTLVLRATAGIVLVCLLYNSNWQGWEPLHCREGSSRWCSRFRSGLTIPLTPTNTSSLTLRGNSNYYMKNGAVWKGTLYCPSLVEADPLSYLRLTDFFSEESEWRKDASNILLAETSCKNNPTYREWCAVESLARQNPMARVWYVMTSRVLSLRNGLAVRLVERYPNLRPVTANLQQVFSGTPLMNLYTSREWNRNTTWPAVSLSNMARLALVWHVGGFYSDTDVVCIAPVTALRNVVGLYDDAHVNNAAFHFDRHKSFLHAAMTYISVNFRPDIWGVNGPKALTNVLTSACGADQVATENECMGVRILNKQAFYPLSLPMWDSVFRPLPIFNINRTFSKSYLIHMWNKYSYQQPIVKGSGSIYDVAAKTFCPVTWEAATVLY
ncbi:lactosylceramide 4-alpha-galactosyltransferase-like [Panulirus ornatus]|uniref:lactosylceramide 4-alpha-galactosyltransferase-like n=1 Tax=Panulirus ornatus TaxID=150431 RepID=UPI003A887CC9